MRHTQDGDALVGMLEAMMLIRRYEQTIVDLSVAGEGPGTCTSVGQEAVAVGVVRALAAHDRLLTNHRSAGHLLARGADPGRLIGEVLGRSTGYCKGKSGHLHVSARELGVILTSTIVGGELALAPDGEHLVPLGRAATLREGRDVTLVSYAKTVHTCVEAAQRLAAQGISAEVVDLRSLKPLDEAAILASARKTGRVVVVHEAGRPCGVGAEIAALLAEAMPAG